MPVHRVKGGYRWGTHGKVYRTRAGAERQARAGAERQARAAYANGYRGDGIHANRLAENRYVRDLREIMAGVHLAYEHAVRRDSVTANGIALQSMNGRVLMYIRTEVPRAFDRMAGKVDRTNARAAKALLPVSVGKLGLGHIMDHAREANVRLIEGAASAYRDDLLEVLTEGADLRVEDLAARIKERAEVSQSRAELIARDQTLKLNGQLTKARQQSAGVSEYIWNTSGDERVRESHQELQGEKFSWDNPPAVGHPGQDFQCRCVPIPVVPGLD